jgi:hypothetical protein
MHKRLTSYLLFINILTGKYYTDVNSFYSSVILYFRQIFCENSGINMPKDVALALSHNSTGEGRATDWAGLF